MKKVYIVVFLIFLLISLMLYFFSVMVASSLNSPKNYAETLGELDDLAKVLEQQDEKSFKKAVYSYQEALLHSEKTLGKESPETLKIMNSLAVLLHGKREKDDPRSIGDVISVTEAGEVCRKTIYSDVRVPLSEVRNDVTGTVLRIGVSIGIAKPVLSAERQLTEAEALYRKTLELRSKVLGPEHPDTLISMNNLAILLADRGDRKWFPDASALQRIVLEVRKKVLGEESPDTLRSMHNLALVVARGDRKSFATEDSGSAETERLQRGVLELRQKVLGEDHPDTLWSMENLAIFLGEKRREGGEFLVEAENLQRKVLKLRQKRLGKDAPDTLRSMNYLMFFLVEGDDSKSLAEARLLKAELKKLENK